MNVTATTETTYAVSDDDVLELVTPVIEKAVAGLPKPEDGKDSTEPGPAGASAYEVWEALGNTGTEADFIASLKGDPGTPGASSAAGRTTHDLDQFKGDNDDQKLADWASYAAAQTVKPILTWPDNRVVTLAKPLPKFDGMKILDYGRATQVRGANSMSSHIKYTGGGLFFDLTDRRYYDIELEGSFEGTLGASQFMAASDLWTSTILDIALTNWGDGLGSDTKPLVYTACSIGANNINNSVRRAFYGKGSDSLHFPNGGLIDSPPSIHDPKVQHMVFNWDQKAEVGPLYVTAEGCGGILVQSTTGQGQLTFRGLRLEGRNANQPATTLFEVQGGDVILMYPLLDYATVDLVKQSNGFLTLAHLRALQGPNANQATKILTQTGGDARIYDARAQKNGVAVKPTYSGASVSVFDGSAAPVS